MALFSYITWLLYYFCLLVLEYLICWLFGMFGSKRVKDTCAYFRKKVVSFHLVSTLITLMLILFIPRLTGGSIFHNGFDSTLIPDIDGNLVLAEPTLLAKFGSTLLTIIPVIQFLVYVVMGVKWSKENENLTLTTLIAMQTLVCTGIIVLYIAALSTELGWFRQRCTGSWSC